MKTLKIGMFKNQQGMKLSDNDVRRILEMRERGMKISEIAKMFGVSPRRIQQVIRNPAISKPGRKSVQVPLELRELIIQLRKEGLTITQIQRTLHLKGYNISRYKIWKTLKEYEKKELLKTINILKRLRHGDGPIVYVDIIRIRLPGRDKKLAKLFLILNASKGKVTYCDIFESLTLRDTVDILDRYLQEVRPSLVILSRTPPFVPTRGSENKLTRHLKSTKIPYTWIPEGLSTSCRRDAVRMIKKIFKSGNSCLENLPQKVEICIEKICEVVQGGNTKQNKEIFNDQNC